MSAQLLFSHFDRISEAPAAVPRLRRFILDLAVRGKLVPQDLNDEPGAELLKRLQAEKAKLAKEGTIRIPVSLKLPSGTGLTFPLPSGWAASTLHSLCISVTDGDHLPPPKAERGIPFLVIGNIRGARLNFDGCRHVTEDYYNALDNSRRPKEGDILYTLVGSYGIPVMIADGRAFCVQRHIGILRPPVNISARFLYRVLESKWVFDQATACATGIAQKTVPLAGLRRLVLPLSPFAEQLRIVAKVDELMEMCDRLAEAQNECGRRRDRLTSASLYHVGNADGAEAIRKHADFYLSHLPRLTAGRAQIKQLRKTILTLAVRGQLVPQDPKDEPATELLQHIKAEKGSLVNGRWRDKYPELPAIDSLDTPFSLPAGWAWARFPELGTFGRGKSKHRPRNDASLFVGGTHLFIQTGDVARSNGVINTYTRKYNEFGLAQSLKWPKGTLCITIAANIADSGILSFDACFPDSVVGFIPAAVFPNARYFEYFIRTAKANLLEFAPATAQKNINLEILNAVLIPLPPLAEQKRIVAKVDQLMALCDQLEAKLTMGQADSRRLLEAVLHEALISAYGELTL